MRRAPGARFLLWTRSPALRRGAAIFALFLTSVIPLAAQEYSLLPSPVQSVHKFWSAAHGLPINQITGGAQLQSGYLWFTTFDGLIRFDGQQFKLFGPDALPELPSTRFSSLPAVGKESLWITTQTGELLHFRKGEFQDLTPAIGGGRVFQVQQGSDGKVWVAGEEGLFVIEEGGNPVRVEVPGPASAVRAVAEQVPGTLWVVTETGWIHRLSASDPGIPGSFQPFQDLLPRAYWRLAADPTSGQVWAMMDTQMAWFDGRSWVPLPPLPTISDLPVQIHPPQDGRPLWVELIQGAFALVDGRWEEPALNSEGREWTGIGVEGPDGAVWLLSKLGLTRDGVPVLRREGLRGFLVDHEGSTWIWGDGIHQLRRASVRQLGVEDGYPANVYALHAGPSGRIWMTSLGELAGERNLVVLEPTGELRKIAGQGLPVPDVEMAVLEERDGSVWVALSEGGVCRLERGACLADGIQDFDGRRVQGVFQSRSGDLWFGTDRGLYGRTLEGRWRLFTEAEGLPHLHIRGFAEDRRGRIWLATLGGGVARWDGERVDAVIGVEEGLSSQLVRSILVDSQGILWVGTEGRGLNRVEEVSGAPDGRSRWRVTSVRSRDGLFDDGIHSILEDDQEDLWMSSNRGIFRVRRDELESFARGQRTSIGSTSFTERDGLRNREMNGGVQGSGIRDREGRLWFAGMAGVAQLDPTRIPFNRVPPEVRIEEIRFDGEVRVPSAEGLTLATGTRDFEVTFTALSFVAPENLVFRYRLRGFSDAWEEIGNRRTAYFTNVPPGRFTFEVLAANNDGVWSAEAAQLDLDVPPLWTERAWIRLAGVLLLVGLGFGGAQHLGRQDQRRARELEIQVSERTQVVEAQAARLRALDEAKSRLFADVSHEFRTPLTLVLGPLEEMLRATQESESGSDRSGLPHPLQTDLRLAVRSARRLMQLVEQVMDLTRLEAGRLDFNWVEADPLPQLRDLMASFLPLAERRRIDLSARMPEELPPLWHGTDLLEKVVGNLLSNAIKYTLDGGAVRLTVLQETLEGGGSEIRVSVKDSGPGIPAKEIPHLFDRYHRGKRARDSGLPGTGIGLSLAHQMIQVVGGQLLVESEEGFGSTFTATFRTGTAHLPAETRNSILRGRPSSEPEGRVDVPGEGWIPTILDPLVEGEEEAALSLPPTLAEEAPPLVLVVEDNAPVRGFIRRVLSPEFRVLEAVHAVEALELLKGGHSPDLILSDLMMPEMDGLEFVQRVRKSGGEDPIPVILLTARTGSEDRLAALEQGAADFLTKPFDANELRLRIRNRIQLRRAAENRRPVIHLRAGDVEIFSEDQRFLQRVCVEVEREIANPDFDSTALARAVGLSRSALYRKLQALEAGSPAELIRKLRMERAAQLLEGGRGSVRRVAREVGYRSVAQFSRTFKGHHGASPSDRGSPS